MQKANAATKSGKTKQKSQPEDSDTTDEKYVVSKKFPFNKVKSNGSQKPKKQPKRDSDEIDIEETLEARKVHNSPNVKKLKDQITTKSDKTNDISKDVRKKKAVSKTVENDSEVVGKGKKTKTNTKKNLSKKAVQNNESHDEDIDIISMHNSSHKNKKSLKKMSSKKKELENDSNSISKKQTKNERKIKVSKNNNLKKKKRSTVDEDADCSQDELTVKKVTKGI